MEYIFEDILEIKNGKNQKAVENPDGKYPIYGSGGVMGYADDYICEPDTVIIGRKGNINNPIYVDEAFWNVDTAFGLQAKREVLNPRYLFYFCKRFDFEKLNKTVTIPSLTKSDLLKIKIDLPGTDEQLDIVEKLTKLEGVIDLRKQELNKLDELIKARFVELFGDPVSNPMKWPVKMLKDLSVQINSGNTPKGGSENYVEEGITFFRSQNVWKDRLEMDDIAYIDAKTHASMKRSSLKHGDILMTKTGRINTENSSLGRAALYDGEDDMANVNGHVYFIRLKDGVNNKFILRILVSPEYRDLIRSVCVGGIDKRQLNKEHIEDFPIICPPTDMVDDYVAFVEQVDKSKVVVQKALDKVQLLFDSLMQEYFG
ncbi:MAG: restriction endonuclease subunit S [Eubacterium sp.]|nr:restriction endonuclease subunit S [Eubacterium sp.]